jgi:DNA (cytosine-5)-methyltransferase 1
LQIVDFHKTPIVILENVKNLTSHDNKKTFQVILEQLAERGYHVRYKVLNTARITGIPQHRERIYIVAMRSKELYDRFTLDFPERPMKKITEILEKDIPEKYYYTESSGAWKLLKDVDMKPNTVYQYRRVYVRENKSEECPTLTANMGSGGHNVPIVQDTHGKRKLTPRECFTLQGFPSSYMLPTISDSKLYGLAGNAVSVPVVELIAERLVGLVNIPSNEPV